jgi:myo-inositol 2-dehydrogenase/D-chiro-inositol 1-dehydrogenase
MKPESNEVSRRSLLQMSGAGATAFTIIKPELVRGAGNERLKAGLVGCGGRGTQAATQLLTGSENVELVAMGDILRTGSKNRSPRFATGPSFPIFRARSK